MRTYGRVLNEDTDQLEWVEVTTDANGYNDEVYLTTFCQVLLLNLNESPFYANFGIPAEQSVLQQAFPDYYVALTQQYFAQFFASLRVNRGSTIVGGVAQPTYAINVLTNQGASLNASIEIPT